MSEHEVWARADHEPERSLRFSGERIDAEDVALGLARGSGDKGAMSVCVLDPLGKVVWAAGEGFEQFGQAAS